MWPSVCSDYIEGGGIRGSEYHSRYQEYGVQPRVAAFKPHVEPVANNAAMDCTTTSKWVIWTELSYWLVARPAAWLLSLLGPYVCRENKGGVAPYPDLLKSP